MQALYQKICSFSVRVLRTDHSKTQEVSKDWLFCTLHSFWSSPNHKTLIWYIHEFIGVNTGTYIKRNMLHEYFFKSKLITFCEIKQTLRIQKIKSGKIVLAIISLKNSEILNCEILTLMLRVYMMFCDFHSVKIRAGR